MAKRGKVKIINGARVCLPHNETEFECYEKMVNNGYTVIKSGYPDLFCFKDNKIILIECKHGKKDTLKANQKIMLKLFASYGIPCYRYDKGGEMVQILPNDTV